MRQQSVRLWIGMTLFLCATTAGWARTICVDASVLLPGDGTCWLKPYRDLQSALAAAVSGDEIWVKKGIYRPTAGTDRTVSFQLKSGVALYGGFCGGESERYQRDLDNCGTILSGDLLGNDSPPDSLTNNGENSYHVVVGSGTDATAVLDGFTIRGGNANGSYPFDSGGGLYLSDGSPTVRSCTFKWNRAESYGGGMAVFSTFSGCSGGAPTVDRCQFLANTASGGGGLAIHSGGPAQVSNCLFAYNSATAAGGGLYLSGSIPVLNNCTVTANDAYFGGGVLTELQANPAFHNSIIAGNTLPDLQSFASTPLYCHTMLGGDPQFVDPAGGDFHLRPDSPAVDAGENGCMRAGSTDLDGSPRIADIPSTPDVSPWSVPPIVDLGAYELYVRRNRYLSFKPIAGNVALRVTLVATGLGSSYQSLVGKSWWVQAHASGDPAGIFRLGCTPTYRSWGSAVIHVGDDEIFPSSKYRIDAVPATGTAYTPPMVVSTVTKWGDIAGPKSAGVWSPPDGITDTNDSDAAVECFQGQPGAPPLASCDVDPAIPNALVNVTDISRIVDAKSFPYPFPAPGACPSAPEAAE